MDTKQNMEIIRKKFEQMYSDGREDAEISLEFQEVESIQLAQLIIRSDSSKNALNGKMISQLTQRVDELERWCTNQDLRLDSKLQSPQSRRCLLIKGHGGTFCSGSDLKAVSQTLDCGPELAEIMQYNLVRLSKLPVVSVAYVEGYALGGGAEVALAADLRIMSESARLGFVHAKNGICCGWSGGTKLVQLVGRARALELLSSGRLVGKEEAEAIGLACEWQQSVTVVKFCVEHAIASARTSQAIKDLVQAASNLPTEQALEIERQLFASTWGKGAHLEALKRNMKHNK